MNKIYFSNTTKLNQIVELYKTQSFNDLQKILILINDCLEYNIDVIVRLNSLDVNCSINLNKEIIFFNDLIFKLDFNKEDISAFLGHEFGHLYLHKTSYTSLYNKGSREYNWDIEFNADRICVKILKDLNMNPNALKNLHQKVLKCYTLKDIADDNHPTLQERIDRL